jgi:hypothetical protein
MQSVARTLWAPAELHPFAQTSQRTLASSMLSFALAYGLLKLSGKHGFDRSPFSSAKMRASRTKLASSFRVMFVFIVWFHFATRQYDPKRFSAARMCDASSSGFLLSRFAGASE